jgi:hypothetical protein
VTGGAEEQKKGEGKGFAGLSSLVSDVDTTPHPAAKSEHAGLPPEVARKTDRRTEKSTQFKPQPVPEKYQTTSQPSSGLSVGRWILGIAAAIGVFWLIGESNKTPSYPTAAYSPSTGTQAKQSKRSAEAFLDDDGSSAAQSQAQQTQGQGNNRFNQFDPLTAKPITPQVPTRPEETVPPVGQNLLLSTAQIRYCLAEGIRLEGAKSAVNNYIDSDVDRFNAMVADYNSRCGQYRYRSGALEAARSEVEAYRSTMQSEGRARLSRPGESASMSAPIRSRLKPYSGTAELSTRRNEVELNLLDLKKPFEPELNLWTPNKKSTITDGERVLALMEKQSGVWTAVRYRKAYAAFKAAEHADLARQQFWKSKADYALELADKLGVASSSTENSKASSPGSLSFSGTPNYQQRNDAVSARPKASQLSSEERQSIESVCLSDKLHNGPSAYNKCVQNQLASLDSTNRRPDLSRLSSEEQQSIENVCLSDKLHNGPAAYNRCVQNQLASLSSTNRRPDLSRLSSEEQQSIESVCLSDKLHNGPAAYNLCLKRQLSQLQN